MQNLELKAKYPDIAGARQIAAAIGAKQQWRRRQIDTYFKVTTGKLKVREEDDKKAELIAYNREAQANEKISEYDIYTLEDPASFKQLLSAVLETLVEVKKQRELFLWKNVRIHLDTVASLGCFMELEAVIDPKNDVALSRERIHTLKKQFQIRNDDLINVGYFELLMEQV